MEKNSSVDARIQQQKLDQAVGLVRKSGLDAWITFVRETGNGGDPVLPLLIDGGLTWQSALIVFESGQKIAVVGNYDADPLIASGDWDEVIPYVQDIKAPLLETLSAHILSPNPRIGLNYSVDDCKADGLTHGMYQLFESMVEGTRFSAGVTSAQTVVTALRAQKTPAEISCMKSAIAEGDRIFEEFCAAARVGQAEREIYDLIQADMDSRGLGYGWDRAGNPIVNSGPNSMIGHGVPSVAIKLEPEHIFHVDLGVIKNGYSSDIQRVWFIGENVPSDVQRAFDAVTAAIDAGVALMRAGALGWEIDLAARTKLVEWGYPEYQHAFGHQVGRAAHDGGAVLGPQWARYGRTPFMPLQVNEVYTVELGITVPGRGYLGLEEMVQITETGVLWLSDRQTSVPLLSPIYALTH